MSELPSWWSYPAACHHGHPWGPGLVTVGWMPCECPEATAANLGHLWVRCHVTEDCSSIWYRPVHSPGQVFQFGNPAVAVILEPVNKTYPPVPPRDDLLALVRAAQENAKDLVSEAQLLADNSRYPRAFALATLALEEMGKAQLCLHATTPPQPSPEDFWTTFRSHEGKLFSSHRPDGSC